ncbi:MAG: anthranilate phosphoribosyltransferase [Myxococcota bacterium]
MSKAHALKTALKQVSMGQDLSESMMTEAMGEIMDGVASEALLAGFLVGLRVKGETPEEIAGAVRAMRERAVRIQPNMARIMDTCGTGGDGAGTFNISTAVAFVCAAAGITVAKHGNRAISSRVGSADVLEALGVNLNLTPAAVTQCIDELDIGFMFAPHHHGALRHAGPVRRELGFRTLLNLLGPLTNPAGATHQLVGIFDPTRVATIAGVLGRLGATRALVVHGCDGLDEITLAGPTHAALWSGSTVEELTLHPKDVGLDIADASALAGGDAAHNATIIRQVLSGDAGPRADIVRLNAGASLWVAEATDTLSDGVAMATDLMRSGDALVRLEQLAALSQKLAS